MYKVKGADGGVYGPVLTVVIQQWIEEGRLNGDSLICRDGEDDWRPLREYPEFLVAMTQAAIAQSASAPAMVRNRVLAQVKTPGLMLVLFGVLMALITLMGLVGTLVQGEAAMPTLPPNAPEWIRNLFQMQASMPKWASYAQIGVSAVVDGLVILGGIHLMRMRSRGLVLAAAILASLPCFTSCCCLGLPLAIWVIALTNKPDVRPHFSS